MATRQIIIGGIAGEIVACACAHIVEEARTNDVREINQYQHKQKEADSVPFLDVYSEDRDLAAGSARFLNNQCAIYPEMILRNWSVERVIVTEESQTKSRHYAKALVIFRGGRNYALRLWVEVEKKYAENGNNYQNAQCCWRVSDEEQKKFLDVFDNPVDSHLETTAA